MELLSFGLYLFSLVFLLFPFLLSCLSCDSFCWFPFRLRFFLLIPFVFFLSCFSSCCICILSSFCFPPASILFIRRFRFPVWFRVLKRSQNEGKNEGKIHDKQLGMNLARSRQTFFPILLLLRQLPLPLRGLVVLLLQAFVLPAPAKAPTAPASPRLLLLLLMQLLLMLMLLVLVLVAACSCW